MQVNYLLEDSLKESDIRDFQRGNTENQRFWSRFGEKPKFTGATILDVGSGWGSLCVDMALHGASRVIGLDIKCRLVDFANHYSKKNYPNLDRVVEFQCLDLRYYPEGEIFDIIVSKDSFEHIVDLERMLAEMKKRLKTNGKIFAGFGPLYTSPYGDHDRRRIILKPWGLWGRILTLIPWGHLFLEATMVKLYNQRHEKKISSMRELQLNKYAWSDYKAVFQKSGLQITYLSTNNSSSLPSRVLSVLAKIPSLEDYCIHNAYCILEKRR